MYLQCIEILAKLKFEINEKRREKIWASPSKIPGKRKVEIPFGYFIGGHCVCACVCAHAHVYVHVHMCVHMHVYVHVCVCACIYVCMTEDNVCDIHVTLSSFQSICDSN